MFSFDDSTLAGQWEMNNELVPVTQIPEHHEKEEISRINAYGLMKKEIEDETML